MRFLMSVLMVLGIASFSYGGECINGLCKKSSQGNSVHSKRMVVKTPWVVRRPLVTKK
jgi:hypothetical protein